MWQGAGMELDAEDVCLQLLTFWGPGDRGLIGPTVTWGGLVGPCQSALPFLIRFGPQLTAAQSSASGRPSSRRASPVSMFADGSGW